MYLMSSKYSEYLNLYLQIWKSACTWLKYFKKYLTPILLVDNVFPPDDLWFYSDITRIVYLYDLFLSILSIWCGM